MALIKCEECGKEISDKAEKCPNCGYPISLKFKNESPKNFLNANKHIIFKMSIIIALIMTFTLVIIFFQNTLSDYEQTALQCCEKLINTLKDPDSFKFQNDILYIKHTNNIYVYIDYTANNSYGGTVRSTAIFANNSYVGDLDDKYENVLDYSNDFLDAKLTYLKFIGDGEKQFDVVEKINSQKISKKLK